MKTKDIFSRNVNIEYISYIFSHGPTQKVVSENLCSRIFSPLPPPYTFPHLPSTQQSSRWCIQVRTACLSVRGVAGGKSLNLSELITPTSESPCIYSRVQLSSYSHWALGWVLTEQDRCFPYSPNLPPMRVPDCKPLNTQMAVY